MISLCVCYKILRLVSLCRTFTSIPLVPVAMWRVCLPDLCLPCLLFTLRDFLAMGTQRASPILNRSLMASSPDSLNFSPWTLPFGGSQVRAKGIPCLISSPPLPSTPLLAPWASRLILLFCFIPGYLVKSLLEYFTFLVPACSAVTAWFAPQPFAPVPVVS